MSKTEVKAPVMQLNYVVYILELEVGIVSDIRRGIF